MTRYEALKIFNLSENFTENELKKAYRTLAKKYHPDNFSKNSFEQKQAQEKMKEINEAKDLLDKSLKNNSSNEQSYFDLENYKNDLINKLSKYKFQHFCPDELKTYNEQIEAIVFWFKLDIKIILLYANDKNKINEAYQEHLNLIIQVFKDFKKDFFDKHNIDESKIKENINYECNLEEFYNQLLKIKEKYDLKEIYRKKIEHDLNDYKLRAGYDYLKELIEFEIDNILKRLKNNNYTNYEEELNKGKKEIDEIFKDYFNYLVQFNEIQKFLDNQDLNDTKIAKIYYLFKSTWDNFNNHISLYDTGENLKKINSLIEEYKKYQQNLMEYNEFISYASSTIINNYQNALSKFTLNNLEKAKLATATLNKIFEIIGEIKGGAISVDKGKLLFKIKFESFDEDEKILNKIRGLDDSKGIYILNTNNFNYGDIAIGTVISEDENYVVIQGAEVISGYFTKTKIIKERFNQMYIPIYLWLSNCQFSGKDSKNFIGEIILYYNDNFCISYDKTTNLIKFHWNSATNDTYNPEIENFKDISYMINKIEETLEKNAENTNSIKTKKRGKIC